MFQFFSLNSGSLWPGQSRRQVQRRPPVFDAFGACFGTGYPVPQISMQHMQLAQLAAGC